jgi:hypothetical protein
MPAIELITLPKLGQKYAPDKALEEEHFAVYVATCLPRSDVLTSQLVTKIQQRQS